MISMIILQKQEALALKTLIFNKIVTEIFDPLPPICVTFFLQIANGIQLDPPPSYLGTVTKYSGFWPRRGP